MLRLTAQNIISFYASLNFSIWTCSCFFLSVSSYLICFLHIILEAALIFPMENKTDNETLWAQEMQHQGDSFSVITCTMLSWFKKTSLPSAQWFSLCSPQPVAAQLLRHRDTKKSEETIFFFLFYFKSPCWGSVLLCWNCPAVNSQLRSLIDTWLLNLLVTITLKRPLTMFLI